MSATLRQNRVSAAKGDDDGRFTKKFFAEKLRQTSGCSRRRFFFERGAIPLA